MAKQEKKQESEKNTELMKSYERIRNYLRHFYVYGFESKGELSEQLQQSNRTYDNERKRIENWLGRYMDFRNEHGRIWYINFDASTASHNPLYESWKAKSFTDYDIMLHFYLLDILRGEKQLSKEKIVDRLNDVYLCHFKNSDELLPDTSTIDKKLKEYCSLGLLDKQKQGRTSFYSLADDRVKLASWQSACAFFSEAAPLGELGAFMLDKLPADYDCFAFKHHLSLYTLDSGILYKLLEAMGAGCWVRLLLYENEGKQTTERLYCPLKLYCSTQTGRRYILCYAKEQGGLHMQRLDKIKDVEQVGACTCDEYEQYFSLAQSAAPYIWGASLESHNLNAVDGTLEHLEFTVYVGAGENYILRRLQREKRSGVVTMIDAEHYRFSIDVYDAQALLMWLRTFIMRITSFKCSNEFVEQRFLKDLHKLAKYYSEEMATDGEQ